MRRASLGIIVAASLGIVAAAFPGGTAMAQARAPRVQRVGEVVVVPVSWGLERVQSAMGIVVILGLAFLLSTDRKAISKRVLFWGLVLQWAFALVVLRWEPGRQALELAGAGVQQVLNCALAGASMVFGPKLVDPAGKGSIGFVFAFIILPTVIFVAALFAVLYHLGVMQIVVRGIAFVMEKLMGTSGAESLNVAASLFLGQTEAPLTIRPYLPKLTRSELLTVMTSGMAHVSGGVIGAYIAAGVEAKHILTAVIMTAPGTILLSKMLIPETGTPETRGGARPDAEKPDANLLDAASRGTREGLGLALNIGAMLISFLALIALINLGLGSAGHWLVAHGASASLEGLSLQRIFGWLLAPVAYLLGVSWHDCPTIGGLLGTRTVLNELIAFGDLGKAKVDPRSFTIATYALCGFANFSSIGIQLGGIGALAPERRVDLARLGFRALLAGTLANFLSACIAGILL